MELSSPLLLLFDVSQLEVRSKFDAFVAQNDRISIDPLGLAEKSRTLIVSDGLTLECVWTVSQPNTEEYRKIFSTISDESIRSLMGLTLHPHLEGGLKIPEIARAYLALGGMLAKHLGAISVMWKPAGLQTGVDYFVESVELYASGGVFPVLPTIDFAYGEEGNVLRSKGAAFFCDQEFELRSEQLDHHSLMRRAIRFAHDLATKGAVEDAQNVPDMDFDKVIQLLPSADGTLLRCCIVSKSDKVLTLG